MKLIVWLGNPGDEYVKTRHNIWFIMIDKFCDEKNYWPWKLDKNFNAEIIKEWDTIFCKPQTFMNKSWDAVKKISFFYKINPKDILVLHDEIDLPTWKIQKKIGWSPAWHNWIKSILAQLQNSNTFTKIRIWVDRPSLREQVIERVLENFSNWELTEIDSKKDVIFWYVDEFIGTSN